MNELKRKGTRTREQLTFSDTYLVLDNLRDYDFDLVSFYVTFNQYIDRRNYEGKADNSLIFANNEALFKAFNVSRNRFYRLFKLSYECGLIDIEKGSNNRNIYILNDIIPFEPLSKIRNWEDRNVENRNDYIGLDENKIDEINGEDGTEDETLEKLYIKEKKAKGRKYSKKTYPEKGQLSQKTLVPKKDEDLSQIGTTSYPKKGQVDKSPYSCDFNTLDNAKNTPNRSKDLIDLSFNSSKSISQSIYNTNIDSNTKPKPNPELESEYEQTIISCEINHIDKNYKEAVIRAIKLLFLDIENKKIIKIGENLLPTEMVRNDLKKLTLHTLEHAINKFKKASGKRLIKNSVAYLKSCIYNSIFEIQVDIDGELRYLGLI